MSRRDPNPLMMAGRNVRNKKLRNANGIIENSVVGTPGQWKDVLGNYTRKVCYGEAMKGLNVKLKKN